MIRTFSSGSKADYSNFVQQLLQVILQLMNDKVEGVYTEAYGALDSLLKVKLLSFYYKTLHSLTIIQSVSITKHNLNYKHLLLIV